MILTITTTHKPATDLGYLLHKNPAHCQSSKTAYGTVHTFYPEATEERCTAAILFEVDPVGMIRGRRHSQSALPLDQYVNDRPYVASSFLSVVISQVFGAALRGKCPQRPELAEMPIPLEVKIDVLPCRQGDDLIGRLFGPLGYEVTATRLSLDNKFPEWGPSAYYSVVLRKHTRLSDLLNHLYVLMPVLDNQKHYYISEDEIEKLLVRGAGWLAQHPDHQLITKRYLKHKMSLAREALARLTEESSDSIDPEFQRISGEETHEREVRLYQQRLDATVGVLRTHNCQRVLDLGCGEGKLIQALLDDRYFTEIVGLDVSIRALETASTRLHLDRLPTLQKARVKLVHGSLIYRDRRLEGYDGAAVLEVVEHLDPPRLAAFERCLFEFAQPRVIVLTTPNSEYNVLWPSLGTGQLRHEDHRFEWTRQQFLTWVEDISKRYGFTSQIQSVGPEHPDYGPPTQMAILVKAGA